jgi:putative transcriptional regulator
MSIRTDKSHRSEIAGAVHEMISDAHDAGVVSRATLRSFDEACLAPAPVLASEEIKAIREREHVSQPVFAAYLNGPALRLLSIIQRKGLQALA